MFRVTAHMAVLLLVAVSSTCAADETPVVAPEPLELRNAPPMKQVRSITAGWFDDGYRSFVRGWPVPRRHWKSVLETVKACKKQKGRKLVDAPKAMSNYIHLRIRTKDGRSLLILSGRKGGDLRAFPFKGCKAPFPFAASAAPFLRDRLGRTYRIAVKEEQAKGEGKKKN